jgi:hypothetical protein
MITLFVKSGNHSTKKPLLTQFIVSKAQTLHQKERKQGPKWGRNWLSIINTTSNSSSRCTIIGRHKCNKQKGRPDYATNKGKLIADLISSLCPILVCHKCNQQKGRP